ncbi:MAG: pilus assembly protein TadG-related protein, partial [Methylophilaceae bacterium]
MSTHSARTTEIVASPACRQTNQQGAVAIIVAIAIPVLIGFMGLALDLGKLYVAKTELQNGADACALAASRELTGVSTNQLTIAEAAGIATGIQSNVLFQSEAMAVPIDSAVTFSQTLDG